MEDLTALTARYTAMKGALASFLSFSGRQRCSSPTSSDELALLPSPWPPLIVFSENRAPLIDFLDSYLCSDGNLLTPSFLKNSPGGHRRTVFLHIGSITEIVFFSDLASDAPPLLGAYRTPSTGWNKCLYSG